MEGVDFGWLMNLLAEPWPPATLGAPRMEGSPAPSEEPVHHRCQADECAQSKNGDAVENV